MKPVDNRVNSVDRTRFPQVIDAQFHRVKELSRQLALNESPLRPTVSSEGHPRGNGDGPLTNLPTLQTTKGG